MKQAKLKSAIKMANLTQGKVAEAIGISSHGMNIKLNGKAPFMLDEALAICDLLGINNPRFLFEKKGG